MTHVERQGGSGLDQSGNVRVKFRLEIGTLDSVAEHTHTHTHTHTNTQCIDIHLNEIVQPTTPYLIQYNQINKFTYSSRFETTHPQNILPSTHTHPHDLSPPNPTHPHTLLPPTPTPRLVQISPPGLRHGPADVSTGRTLGQTGLLQHSQWPLLQQVGICTYFLI